jgi:hypothetical protein
MREVLRQTPASLPPKGDEAFPFFYGFCRYAVKNNQNRPETAVKPKWEATDLRLKNNKPSGYASKQRKTDG